MVIPEQEYLESALAIPTKRSSATFTELLEARKRQRQEENLAQEQLHAALLQQLAGDASTTTNELLAELTQIQSLSSYSEKSLPSQSPPSVKASASSASPGTGGRGPYKVALCMYHQTKGCTKGEDCTFAHGEEELLLHVSAQGGPNKGVMCKFFQQGVCRNGTMCRFAHTADEMLAEAPVTGRTNKTVPCKFFEAGYCGRGELCNFFHDETKAKQAQIAQTEEQLIEALMQQQMIELLSQQAESEEQARAAQAGIAELLAIREVQKQQSVAAGGQSQKALLAKPDTRKVCVFWQRGACNKGDSCPFKHSSDGEDASDTLGAALARPQPFKITICMFWQEGKCLKGADCTFAHGTEDIGGAGAPPQQQFSADSFVVEPESYRKALARTVAPPIKVPIEVPPPIKVPAPVPSRSLMEMFGSTVVPPSDSVQPPSRPQPQPSGFIDVSAEAYQEIAALMCRFHQAGTCKNGAQCAYAHTGQDLVEGLKKMGICNWALQGECTALPGRCKYQHIPDEQLAIVQHVVSGHLTLSPCKFYAQGNCQEGMSCRFMHEGAPLAAPSRSSSAPVTVRPPSSSAPVVVRPPVRPPHISAEQGKGKAGFQDTKQMLCKFFQKGICAKGDACIYAHSEEDINLPQNADVGKFKTRMCAHFETGYCAKGNMCTFAHDESELQEPGIFGGVSLTDLESACRSLTDLESPLLS